MASKQSACDRKMQVLMLIKQHKDILFGAFSDKLTKRDKVEKWKQIGEVARSISLIPFGKDCTYVRDTLWQNWKRNAMLKIHNAKKTGTGGMGKLTHIDNFVLEIIGKESPIICGLGVSESQEEPKFLISAPQSTIEGTSNEDIHNVDNPVPSTSKSTGDEGSKTQKKRKGQIKDAEAVDLKQEKLRLQVEYLKFKNYKMQLEIYKLEQELNLPRSEFTKSLGTALEVSPSSQHSKVYTLTQL